MSSDKNKPRAAEQVRNTMCISQVELAFVGPTAVLGRAPPCNVLRSHFPSPIPTFQRDWQVLFENRPVSEKLKTPPLCPSRCFRGRLRQRNDDGSRETPGYIRFTFPMPETPQKKGNQPPRRTARGQAEELGRVKHLVLERGPTLTLPFPFPSSLSAPPSVPVGAAGQRAAPRCRRGVTPAPPAAFLPPPGAGGIAQKCCHRAGERGHNEGEKGKAPGAGERTAELRRPHPPLRLSHCISLLINSQG